MLMPQLSFFNKLILGFGETVWVLRPQLSFFCAAYNASVCEIDENLAIQQLLPAVDDKQPGVAPIEAHTTHRVLSLRSGNSHRQKEDGMAFH